MANTITLQEANSLMLANASKPARTEIISLFEASGRVLAEDIYSTKALPAFTNSAMDGYVAKASAAGKLLDIQGAIFAGDNVEFSLGEDECYKIMTGAMVPLGGEVVIPFENVQDAGDDFVVLPEQLTLGANIREMGEECNIGDLLLQDGECITPEVVALLASQGVAAIKVYERLEVGIFSTGNEIKEPWEDAKSHQIYNSNSIYIYSFLKEQGATPKYLGILPDNFEEMKQKIASLKKYDMLITSGGISKGEADFVRKAFEANGSKVLFHGVDTKPGKAIMCAKMGETFVISLPGNPLGTMVNLLYTVLPLLKKMQGQGRYQLDYIYAENLEEIYFKDSRTHIVLGSLEGGKFRATRDNRYGSNMITPLVESNALFIRNPMEKVVEKGREIKVFPIRKIFGENLSML